MFETPILLIVFNRPFTTQQTFEVIKRIKPKHLFIAADGPRHNNSMDVERCTATRLIINQIDWPCNLQKLFRDENRGCGHGPAEAINWFFAHVEEGIILEDDCLPDLSFFPYCQALLKHYRFNEQVYMISGTNALKKWNIRESSYFFSYMAHSLGWASWRRAWISFDYNMQSWLTDFGKQKIQTVLLNRVHFEYFEKQFTKYQVDPPHDVWDFQWLFARWLNGGKTIVPSVNLIKNIGFNADATHSFYENDLLANLPLFSMIFPLRPPKKQINTFFDWYLFERFISDKKRSFMKRNVLKCIKLLNSLNII